MQYSQDFGSIRKESLKRKTKWGAKYFTHDKSYYLVLQTSMEFAIINFMQPLLAEENSHDTDQNCYERIRREISSSETKDSPGRNYKGQSRGFTTGSLLEGTRL